jgi:eukaryotic-like serine/threonine-protein kinase
MAEVFKCRLSGIGGFDKLVVIKRIRPELVSDPHFVDMFLDEARIAANLSHSNIIQIYEIDQVAGIPYISMEYVRGPTLSLITREAKAQGRQNAVIAAKVMSGICSALDYAHCATGEDGAPLGIIHRDVTPQNILVSLDGVPKLLDFGVAKARGQIAHTSAGSIKGKFKFMAPEVFLGERAQITKQIDVFAAGVCLYHACTYHLPYGGETEVEVMKAAALGKFPKPSELVEGFDPKLEEIILWAMAPLAKDRCPDARTLHQALEAYALQHGGTQQTVLEHLKALFPDDPACEPGGCADVLSSDIVVTPPPLPAASRSAVLWGPGASLQTNEALVPHPPVPGPRSSVPGPRSSIPNPRSSIPAPRSSMPAPRSSIPAPRTSMPAPRSSLAPRASLGSHRSTVSSLRSAASVRGSLPPRPSRTPLLIRLPEVPVDPIEQSVEIDLADVARHKRPTWLLMASLGLLVSGIITGALVTTRRPARPPEPTPAELAAPVIAVAMARLEHPPIPPSVALTPVEPVVDIAPVEPVVVAAVAPPPDPQRFHKTLAAARAALDQGKFVDAATLVRQVLAEQIDEPAAVALLKEISEAQRRVKAPARPAGPRLGGLIITTDPVAQVFLDGKLLGWSPISRRLLPEGEYQVAARHAKRDPAVQDVRVVAGRDTQLQLQLLERPARVKVTPAPPAPTAAAPVLPRPPAPVPLSSDLRPQVTELKLEPIDSPPIPEPAAPPKPAAPVVAPAQPMLAAVVPADRAKVEDLPAEKRASPAASLTFECTDGNHFVRAAMPDGMQAWCENDSGQKNGRFVRLYPNGRKAEEGEFRSGKKHGRWLDYYEQGGERGRVEWRKGVQSW